MLRTFVVLLSAIMLLAGGAAHAQLVGVDIGGPATPGSTTMDGPGAFTLVGDGADIWGNSDQFHYASEAYTGDFTATVKASSVRSVADPLVTHDWAKAGVMARASLDANSQHAFSARSGHNGVEHQGRGAAGAGSFNVGSGSGDVDGRDVWLQLNREGNWWFTRWAEDDGGVPGAWSDIALRHTVMPETIQLGLAVTSHDDGNPHTASFTDYAVGSLVDFPEADPLTLPAAPIGGWGYMGVREVWQNGDIGDQGAAHASLNSGAGTIVDYQANVLNIQDSGNNGNFGDDADLGVVTAGLAVKETVDNISMLVHGKVAIPAAGDWTFGVNSDDGFTLQFPGNDFVSVTNGGVARYAEGDTAQFWGGRGTNDSLGVINLTEGYHEFVLTWHEGGGGAAVEFFASEGAHSEFASGNFQLVGSPDGVQLVPEPSSVVMLLGLALMGLLPLRNRK